MYVDTSAMMKLVVDEAESTALATAFERSRRSGEDTLVSSLLLHAELHCAANRHREDVPREIVATVLSTVSLIDVESSDLTTAPLLAGSLRTLDAIHLATALRVNARAMLVYDPSLAGAALDAGLRVLQPA